MRHGSWEGSLSLATSMPGALVRCVQLPSQRFFDLWDKVDGQKSFSFIPRLMEIYLVRANAPGAPHFPKQFSFGVLLAHKDNRQPLSNNKVSVMGLKYEPCFPFSCFDPLSGRP